jgi:hypothetical protein
MEEACMARRSETAVETRLARVLRLYREALGSASHSPALWLFGVVWILAAAYLSFAGYASQLLGAIFSTLLPVGVFGLLTLFLTARAPAPAHTEAPPTARGWLWAQMGVLLACIVLIGQRGMVFNHALPPNLIAIPLWTPLVELLDRLWGTLLRDPAIGVNPTLYVIVPGAVLLALGARLPELGVARGYRALAVAALWGAVPLVLIGIALVGGRLTLAALGGSLMGNMLRNGFSEEFLFRGALMTRLARLMGSNSWAIFLSSLTFGLWHLGTNTQSVGGNFAAGAALGIVSQAVFGLGIAFVFLRTRNLLALSLIHVLGNIA